MVPSLISLCGLDLPPPLPEKRTRTKILSPFLPSRWSLYEYPHAHPVEYRSDFVFLAVSMKTRLRVLRAEKEWSQAELAAQVGVARGTINAIETGKYDPSLPLAFKIARVFGKKVEEVFLYPEGQDQTAAPQV
jgi:putative transcriptional regulator